jgi:formylglycine-generating enzyme required for sulfatase activity
LLAGEFRSCEHCPVMVTVAAGAFGMGSNDDPTEKPLHRVTLPAFGIGKFPVSVADWDACAAAGGCTLKPPGGPGDPARMPMTNLSWDDTAQYVAWLRQSTGKPYRLPSEAEWEYAARAGTTTRYWWGEQPGSGHADCEGCGDPHDATHPQTMDTFPPNPWGLYGTSGGVAEWVDDCWHLSYISQQGAPTDGSSWAFANCGRHVLRGGSWRSSASQVTVSSRTFFDANVRDPGNGMRVALSSP